MRIFLSGMYYIILVFIIMFLLVTCSLSVFANEHDPILISSEYYTDGSICSLVRRPSYTEKDQFAVCIAEAPSLLAWSTYLETVILEVEKGRNQ